MNYHTKGLIEVNHYLNQQHMTDHDVQCRLANLLRLEWGEPNPHNIAELIDLSLKKRVDNRQWIVQLGIIGNCSFGGDNFDRIMMLYTGDQTVNQQAKEHMHYLLERGHNRIADDRFSSGIITRPHLMAKLLYLCRDSLPASATLAQLASQSCLTEETVSFLLENVKERLGDAHQIAGSLADMQHTSERYPCLVAGYSDAYLQVIDAVLPLFKAQGGLLSDTVQMQQGRVPLGMFMLDAALSYGGSKAVVIAEKLIDHGLDIVAACDEKYSLNALRQIYTPPIINSLEHYALMQASRAGSDNSQHAPIKENTNDDFTQFSI